MEKFPLVEVTWVDSHAEEGWIDLKDATKRAADKDALKVHNVGYLIAENKDYLLLSSGISPGVDSEDDLVTQTMQIPVCAVLGLVTLREG